jgi:transposase InsO family protein
MSASISEEAIQMIKTVIFPRYDVPRFLISDGGSHFIGKDLKRCLLKLGIEHRVSTTYRPQTNGQAEISNKQLKGILMKTVTKGGKYWSKKLDGALWAYQTAHKTPMGMTPYQLVYGKTCHLPAELEHKAYWVIKKMNLDIDAVRIKRRIQISELEELRLKAYHNASIYKERMKRWYDKGLHKTKFKEGPGIQGRRQGPTIQFSIQGLRQRKIAKQMGWTIRCTFGVTIGSGNCRCGIWSRH